MSGFSKLIDYLKTEISEHMAQLEFNILNLEDFYEIQKGDIGYIGEVVGYRVKNDSFAFVRLGEHLEMKIYLDNFPAQKKWYDVNIPIKTFQQLEVLLQMTGITLNPKKRDEYIIQDSRSFAGNICYWWAKDDKGYTTDLDRAERYTFESAKKICLSRATDKMYLAQSVEFVAKRTVDSQFLPTTTELENRENKKALDDEN